MGNATNFAKISSLKIRSYKNFAQGENSLWAKIRSERKSEEQIRFAFASPRKFPWRFASLSLKKISRFSLSLRFRSRFLKVFRFRFAFAQDFLAKFTSLVTLYASLIATFRNMTITPFFLDTFVILLSIFSRQTIPIQIFFSIS